MLSETIEEVRATAVSGEEVDRFYAGLSAGLHALAQPLTILRSSIAAAGADGIELSKQRRYLDISKSEVERVCELFGSLQELMIAAQSRAEQGLFDPDAQRELP
jgi:hypothetical protein